MSLTVNELFGRACHMACQRFDCEHTLVTYTKKLKLRSALDGLLMASSNGLLGEILRQRRQSIADVQA